MADDGEHCQVCGDAYTDVYRLPDKWWALVTPKPEHPEAGLLCPPCALSRLLSADVLPTGGATTERCPACEGSGWWAPEGCRSVPDSYDRCPTCDGTGVLPTRGAE